MEGWSPRTLLRYGFCQEDEAGNIVSIWNFQQLDEALAGIVSSDDDEDNGTNDPALIMSFGAEPVHNIPVTSQSEEGTILNPAAVGVHSNEDGLGATCDLSAVSATEHFDGPLHGHELEFPSVVGEEGEAGQFGHYGLYIPLSEWECWNAQADFFVDMPSLEGPEVWRSEYPESMPDLERSYLTWGMRDIVLLRESAWSEDEEPLIREVRSFYLCANLILLQVLCTAIKLPVPVFADTLDSLLHMCFLLSG